MTDRMAQADYLRSLLGATKTNQFKMTWEGTKIPRGATINGIEIGWTQHGNVTGVGGEQLGQYERATEFGGATGEQHVMIISTNYANITPPAGGTVEPVIREKGRHNL